MRIALISDLHANDVALTAVLEDIARIGVDQTVCLGDVATLGPEPEAILRKLRELECPCILGNHDEFLFNPELIETYTEAPVVVDAVNWCRDRLSNDDLDYLRGFQPSCEIPLNGDSKLLLYHGSPRSHMEDLLATTPPEQLDEMLAGHEAVVLAGGHTHIQMLRQHRGMLIVNPGSVGLPFKEYVGGATPTILAHAEYAIVHARDGAVDVNLRRVPLDKHALVAAFDRSDMPLRGMLVETYAS